MGGELQSLPDTSCIFPAPCNDNSQGHQEDDRRAQQPGMDVCEGVVFLVVACLG